MRYVAVLCWVAASAVAQTTEPPPSFDVASVKVNTTMSTNSSINDAPGGKLDCGNVTLRMLISFAYNVRDYQILGAPSWAGLERYDVLAKPSAEDVAKESQNSNGPAANERLRQRTQKLLAERFGLAAHMQNREMPVYALVVANGAPKLAESTAERPQMSWNNERVQCKKTGMKRFAEILLASRLNRFVVDKTDLAGEYDFEMHFAANDAEGPSFESALQDQLGLKLITTKATVPFLVIDKADRLLVN
jgi:uncharacterized protein (TIGR03435 family)